MNTSIDDLIALVESRGKNTAVDPEAMRQYNEARFLKDEDTRLTGKIAEHAGINPEAVKGLSRRDVQRVVEEMRTRARDKEDTALKAKYGTTERGVVRKLEGKGPFRSADDQRRMAFSDPEGLASEADTAEALLFPQGRAHSSRSRGDIDRLGSMFDETRADAANGPKSADVTAQRAAAALPEFEHLNTDEVEQRLRSELARGERSAGEAATIRTALKPKAALEEEELMARMRPAYEQKARESDVYQAANELMAPLQDATKLSLPEVRARKRLATELQKRAVDPMDLQGMQNPRALPSKQRKKNPFGPPTLVNPEGQAPGPQDQADEDLAATAEEPGSGLYDPLAMPTTYSLATQARKRVSGLDKMFGG